MQVTCIDVVPMTVADVPVIKLGQHIMQSQRASVLQTVESSKLIPARISGYFQLHSYVSVLFVLYLGFLIKASTKLGFLKRLLLKYPDYFTFGVFKAKGPSPRQLSESSFETIFFGKGYKDVDTHNMAPDYEVVAVVKGPEMGYVSIYN